MRVIFMGTPAFSVPALDAVAAQHDVVAVYSQPPRPAGRGRQPRPSPVQTRAEALGLPTRTPVSLRNDAAAKDFADLRADVAVVVAYGLILPQAILSAPKHGCLNIHASLLPRWRGAAPIHRAIMAGDRETGVCIMQMDAGLDTGPVLLRQSTPIGPQDTTADLHDRLSAMGAAMIVDALSRLSGLTAQPQPQDGITYATKIDKAEARIDWTQPAETVDRQIRALSPFPGAWCDMAGERLKLLRSTLAPGHGTPGQILPNPGLPNSGLPNAGLPNAGLPNAGLPNVGLPNAGLIVACGTGAVRVTDLQREGKRALPAAEALRGLTLPATLT